jgi:polyribonucleotide nucleotidyltransferase
LAVFELVEVSCRRVGCNVDTNIFGVSISKMARMDLLSFKGLRLDGRRANELRHIRCKLGVFSQPDGSAYLEQGNTKVLAAVYGPHEVMSVHTQVKRN